MIIDCHQHTNWHGRTTRDLVAYLDEAHVAKAWVLSWEALDGGREPWYMHLSIEDAFAAAREHPRRFIVGAGADPRREECPALLRRYHRAGARVYGEIKLRILMDTPELVAAFRTAGRLGMPVLFHLEVPRLEGGRLTPWYLGDIDAVDRTLEKCPDTTFIAHGPGWWAHFSADDGAYRSNYPKGPVVPGGKALRLLEKRANLCCDLSANSAYNALTRDPAFGRQFLVAFADRILYGADYVDTKMLDHLKKLDLPKAAAGKILSGNARRLVAM